MKRLFVSNFPFSSSVYDIEALFVDFGVVKEFTLCTDRNTGQSRGFGFIEMESEEDAAAAMEGLDGLQIGGRSLHVALARPQANRSHSKRGDNS